MNEVTGAIEVKSENHNRFCQEKLSLNVTDYEEVFMKAITSEKKRRFPDAIIIGTKKSGTGELTRCLFTTNIFRAIRFEFKVGFSFKQHNVVLQVH